MTTRRHQGGAVGSSQQATSGWVDGEVDVSEDVSSILQDERLRAWDASVTFPRRVRFITCAVLIIVGTASFMYKNMLLHETQEHTILAQIRRSIVEMDEIAATATAMERHVHRLAALTQPHLDQALKDADTSDAMRHDVLRAEVDAIHADTMNQMESMLQAVVETTRQDVLDLAATWTVQLPPTPSSVHAIDLDVSSDLALTDATSEHPTTALDNLTSVEELVQPLPQSPVNHAKTNDTTTTTVPNSGLPKGNPTHFVAFTAIGTLIITSFLVYWMHSRGSFRESRVAFQEGTRRLQRLLALFQDWCVDLGQASHRWLASWGRSASDGLVQLRTWWRRDTNVDVQDVSDDDEDDVSFYPRTPVPTARHPQDARYDELPRKHISFADVDSDEEFDEGGDDDDGVGRPRRPSNLVRTNLYENILTPDPAPPRGFHDESPRRRSSRGRGQF